MNEQRVKWIEIRKEALDRMLAEQSSDPRLRALSDHGPTVERLKEKHHVESLVFARVIAVGFQPAQIAIATTSKGRTVIERIERSWRLLVVREDTGQIVEKKPEEVTSC